LLSLPSSFSSLAQRRHRESKSPQREHKEAKSLQGLPMKKSDRSLSLSKGTIAEAVSGEACIVAR